MKKFITLKVVYVLLIITLMIIANHLPFLNDWKHTLTGIGSVVALTCLSYIRLNKINNYRRNLFNQQESGILPKQEEILAIQKYEDSTWMGYFNFFLGLIAAFSAALMIMRWFSFNPIYPYDENDSTIVYTGCWIIGLLFSFILLKLGVRSSITNYIQYKKETYSMSEIMFYSLVGFDYQSQVVENRLKLDKYTEISYLVQEGQSFNTEEILKRVIGYFDTELKPKFKQDLKSKIEKDIAKKREENAEIELARKLINSHT